MENDEILSEISEQIMDTAQVVFNSQTFLPIYLAGNAENVRLLKLFSSLYNAADRAVQMRNVRRALWYTLAMKKLSVIITEQQTVTSQLLTELVLE